jgi:WXG100 family type VII secretion target
METGELLAKVAQMRDAADTIGRSVSHIDQCLDSIDIEIRALSADRFMSIGAETFRGEYNRLMPRMRETFELLRTFKENLANSADDIELAARSAK